MQKIPVLVVFCLLLAAAAACSTQRKWKQLSAHGTSASLQLPSDARDRASPSTAETLRDTITVRDESGRKLILMRAVKDEATGEMVASDVLDAAVVTARFRHVAERFGTVELEFDISVSDSLQDSRWQLCFTPEMHILADTMRLEPILITGKAFRSAQLRGWQQYERFLLSLARDSLHFVDTRQLEIFLQRNIPDIYRFKTDSSLVSDEQFASAFGVTQQQALEHYTNRLLIRSHVRRMGRKDRMRKKWVPHPIQREGIRLDSVIRDGEGRFVYRYVQLLHTRPGLKKVDIVLHGSIQDAGTQRYALSDSKPLTFYISSLSGLMEERERYKMQIVERRAEANTSCNIAFSPARSELNPSLGDNAAEFRRIGRLLGSLLENEVFDLDSIEICASSSPDGEERMNARLARSRAESVTAHFRKHIRHYRDSLERVRGFSVDENGRIVRSAPLPRIPLSARSVGEDWGGLTQEVEADTLLSEAQKAAYRRILADDRPDRREAALRRESFYPRLREQFYPRLRRVRMAFHLHRKGMVKDTVHTTVIDSLYRAGLDALRDHDYERALELLRPYGDYNTAVAFLARDYPASARVILEKEAPSPRRDYLLALAYAREGEEEKAVQHYLDACRQEPSFVHRGHLDPEIAALIRLYGLDRRDEDENL